MANIITTEAELLAISGSSDTFILDNDITITYESAQIASFSGTLDLNYNTIYAYDTLFNDFSGNLSNGNIAVRERTTKNEHAAGIAHIIHSNAELDNVNISGIISGTAIASGICHNLQSGSTIHECKTDVTLMGGYYQGNTNGVAYKIEGSSANKVSLNESIIKSWVIGGNSPSGVANELIFANVAGCRVILNHQYGDFPAGIAQKIEDSTITDNSLSLDCASMLYAYTVASTITRTAIDRVLILSSGYSTGENYVCWSITDSTINHLYTDIMHANGDTHPERHTARRSLKDNSDIVGWENWKILSGFDPRVKFETKGWLSYMDFDETYITDSVYFPTELQGKGFVYPGHSFTGYHTIYGLLDIGDTIPPIGYGYPTSDLLSATAQWEPNVTNIVFSGHSEYIGYKFIYGQVGAFLGNVSVDLPIPVAVGKVFKHWEYNGQPIDVVTTWVTDEPSITVYPVYEVIQYRLRYFIFSDLYHEEIVDSINPVTLPTPPDITGYAFIGWGYDNTTLIDGDYLTQDTDVYAILEQKFDAVIYPNGGSALVDGIDSDIINLYSPRVHVSRTGFTRDDKQYELVREGYNFLGFSLKQSGVYIYQENSVIELSGQTIIYARWSAKRFKVETVANGGTKVEFGRTVPYNSQIGSLPVTTRYGYNFIGWFLDPELTEEATTSMRLTSDITIYAKWEPVLVTVEYDANFDSSDKEFQEIELSLSRGLSRIVPPNIDIVINRNDESSAYIPRSKPVSINKIEASSEFYEARRFVTANNVAFDSFWWLKKGERSEVPVIAESLTQSDIFNVTDMITSVNASSSHIGLYADNNELFSDIYANSLSYPGNAIIATPSRSFVNSYYGNTVLADGIYPLSYAINNEKRTSSWWSSSELETRDHLEVNFSVPNGVCVNRICFLTTNKPSTITIDSFNPTTSKWEEVYSKDGYRVEIDYRHYGPLPTRHITVDTENLITQGIRINIEKDGNYSVELSNLDLMFAIGEERDLDFIAGRGFTDIVGNYVEVEKAVYDSHNTLYDKKYWLSKPNRDKSAVEYIIADMGFEKQITKLRVMPVFHGMTCNIYLSKDGNNWTPIHGNYVIDGVDIQIGKRRCRYVKLELSNLIPLPFTSNIKAYSDSLYFPPREKNRVINMQRGFLDTSQKVYDYPIDKTRNELLNIMVGNMPGTRQQAEYYSDDYFRSIEDIDGIQNTEIARKPIESALSNEPSMPVKFALEGEHEYIVVSKELDSEVAYFAAISQIMIYNDITTVSADRDCLFSLNSDNVARNGSELVYEQLYSYNDFSSVELIANQSPARQVVEDPSFTEEESEWHSTVDGVEAERINMHGKGTVMRAR